MLIAKQCARKGNNIIDSLEPAWHYLAALTGCEQDHFRFVYFVDRSARIRLAAQ
jgi:hypothetical protein